MTPAFVYKYILPIVLALLFVGCANIVPPEGGKKDETPPVLLSLSPKDSSLNIRPTTISLRFNKFMEVKELTKHMQISPLLNTPPQVTVKGKKIEIKLVDSLLTKNTTYQLDMGNAFVDNRESNPYHFKYTFSTGSYFDSLTLHGVAMNAANGKPDTTAIITLYEASMGDSALLKKKPMYAQKVQSDGKFSFKNLPSLQFRIYAVGDSLSNYLYDQWIERIGFNDELVHAATISNDTVGIVLYTFKEVLPAATVDSLKANDTLTQVAKPEEPSRGGGRRGFAKPKNESGYLVNVDTANRDTRTFELTQPLSIDIFSELQKVDSGKIFLSYDDGGIEIEAVRSLAINKEQIKVQTQWQGDKLYTLRLVKGWAIDTAGKELPPGKYSFKTKADKDYGAVNINIDSVLIADSLVLSVYKGVDSVYQAPIQNKTVRLKNLAPGDYTINIIVDNNKNGKWDPGELFAKKQPERVLPYNGVVVLKAGWENEIDIKPTSLLASPFQKNAASKTGRFANDQETEKK